MPAAAASPAVTRNVQIVCKKASYMSKRANSSLLSSLLSHHVLRAQPSSHKEASGDKLHKGCISHIQTAPFSRDNVQARCGTSI